MYGLLIIKVEKFHKKRKPLDSPERCVLIKGWSFNHYGLFTNFLGDVAYTDEK